MDKIIIKKEEKKAKARRSSVVVSPNTYVRIYTLSQTTGISVERLVDRLLTEALDAVVVEE